MKDLLVAKNLHKRYGQHKVLKGVDFTVHRGEVKAILGKSGSGKSTILRVMNLLEPADAGEVLLEGQRLGVNPQTGRTLPEAHLARQRQHIGMVFQRFNLFAHMNALDNVASGLLLTQNMPRASAHEKAAAMLTRMGLQDHQRHFPSELSGGQQQRVAIARALVLEPKVMLFDEPTSALDPELVGEVLNVIEELAAGGMTMVVVTHEVRFARAIADEVALFHEGQIVEQAPPEQFFDHPQSPITRSFLSHLH
ncbi:amino acid ABC transporter ATP-binding protein [Deinococcus sp.]|uniref:amino acid ABC transporter ATP-binding protein n=1 Tax=Deinococcus sp. TaxID=47478 RepID=UPI0025BD3508|nr:amino acid ABC transporter ATP-binding protein [Deinococcus sp.]